MAYTKTWAYTMAPSVTDRTVTPNNLNFGEDFVVRLNKPGEAILANKTSPLDRIETVRFAVGSVANVYSGTGVDASLQSQNKRGTTILAQIRPMLDVLDSDTSTRILLPFEAHIVLRVPQHPAVGTDEVRRLLNRVIGTLFEDTETSFDNRLSSLLRGSCLPTSLT